MSRSPALSAASQLALHRSAYERALEQLASTRRIHRAADDAAGLFVALSLRAQTEGSAQAARNQSDGISALRVAEGALGETSSLLVRMRELSVQAGNGTLGDDERAILQQEYDALASEVDRIAGSTRFGERSLLDGQSSGAGALTIGDGNGDATAIDVPDQGATSLGVAGADVTDRATLDALDAAIQSVAGTRASLGSQENLLAARVRNEQRAAEESAAAESRIADADYARSVSEATAAQLRARSSVAAAAYARADETLLLRLLEG